MSASPGSVRDQARGASNLGELRRLAFLVIDRIDGAKPGDQLVGTAVALVAAAEAVGLDPHALVRTARNALADLDSPYAPEIRAIRAYAEHEVGRKAGPGALRVAANR